MDFAVIVLVVLRFSCVYIGTSFRVKFRGTVRVSLTRGRRRGIMIAKFFHRWEHRIVFREYPPVVAALTLPLKENYCYC